MSALSGFAGAFETALSKGQTCVALAEVERMLSDMSLVVSIKPEDAQLLRDAQTLAATEADWPVFHALGQTLRTARLSDHRLLQVAHEVVLLLGLRQRRMAELALEGLHPALVHLAGAPAQGAAILLQLGQQVTLGVAELMHSVVRLALYGGQTRAARIYLDAAEKYLARDAKGANADCALAQRFLTVETEILDGQIAPAKETIDLLAALAPDDPSFEITRNAIVKRFNLLIGSEIPATAPDDIGNLFAADRLLVELMGRIGALLSQGAVHTAARLARVLYEVAASGASADLKEQAARVIELCHSTRSEGFQGIGRGAVYRRPSSSDSSGEMDGFIENLPVDEAISALSSRISAAMDRCDDNLVDVSSRQIRRIMEPIEARPIRAQALSTLAAVIAWRGHDDGAIRLYEEARRLMPKGAYPRFAAHLEDVLAALIGDQHPAKSYRHALRATKTLTAWRADVVQPFFRETLLARAGVAAARGYRQALASLAASPSARSKSRAVAFSTALRHRDFGGLPGGDAPIHTGAVAQLRLLHAYTYIAVMLDWRGARHVVSVDADRAVTGLLDDIRQTCRIHTKALNQEFSGSEVMAYSKVLKERLFHFAEALELGRLLRHLPEGTPLAIIADPGLRNLPYAALMLGDVPLIRRHPFALVQEWPSIAPNPRQTLHIFAVPQAVQGLPELPFVNDEVAALRSLGNTRNALAAGLGQKNAALRALATVRPVHFACHGALFPDDPLASGLVLGDGVLTLGDIKSQGPLRSPEVTLSVCEGLDAINMRDGRALSFADVLVEAGVSAVCGFQWKVRDRFASAFFVAYAQHRLEESAPFAMRRALLELQDRSDPAYMLSPAYLGAPAIVARSHEVFEMA